MVERAALLVPLLAESQGDKLAAADGYLRYAAAYGPADAERAGSAVDRAVGLARSANSATAMPSARRSACSMLSARRGSSPSRTATRSTTTAVLPSGNN